MRIFKDAKGRPWEIAVDVVVIKRLRTSIQFDLAGADVMATMRRLIEDPILTCDVVYAIVKPQADAVGISQDDFWGAMAGDPIDNALRAVLEEVTDFTPNRAARERLTLLLRTMTEMAQVKDVQADEAVKGLVAKGLAWAKGETPGPSSGVLQAASESTHPT